jgi:hypothetical protein
MTPLQLSRNKILVIPLEGSHTPERIQPNAENSAPHCALARTAPPGLPTANMSDSESSTSVRAQEKIANRTFALIASLPKAFTSEKHSYVC